jgi:CheY-like chemotaxis protein
MVVATFLEDAGYEVVETSSAEEALQALAREDGADLLVSDVEMGDVSGFALSKMARERAPHIAIVLVSGRQAPSKNELPPGARFLQKPFTPDQLLSEVGAATAV